MKKISYILISVFVFSLVIFSGILMSCELTENKPESMIKAPGVKRIEDGKGLIITVHNVSDVKYINLYRQDVTDADAEDPSPEVNIGVLFPEFYNEHGWVYQDYYVYSGNKYRYAVRYTTKDGKYKSGWSETIDALSEYYPSTDSFKYTIPAETRFEFAGFPDYTLTIKDADISDQNIPDKIFSTDKASPKIVFSNGKIKKAYPLPHLVEGTTLYLRNFLEPEFLNTEITLDSIIFEKLVTTDPIPEDLESDGEDPKVRCVVWGEPNAGEIIVVKKGNGTIENFIVKSTTAEPGYDYSDYIPKATN